MATWTMQDQEKVRAKDAARHAACDALFERYSNEWMAEAQIRHLEEYAEELPGCYPTFESCMTDFWVDFSWDNKSIVQVKLVLADKRLPAIKKKILEKYGFDIEQVLRDGLKDLEKS